MPEAEQCPTEVDPNDQGPATAVRSTVEHLGLSLDEKHVTFTQHVWEQGARFCVVPSQLPNKGIGMVAARDIKAGEQIAFVPTKLLFTTNRISADSKKRLNEATVHGLIAAALTHEVKNPQSRYKLWFKTWPTRGDLEISMPILLPEQYRRPRLSKKPKATREWLLLPPAIEGSWIDSTRGLQKEYRSSGALPKQEVKLKRELDIYRAANGSQTADASIFEYMWLMVNTRSFYYDMPLRTKPKNNEEKMCLCPFLDYFNHDACGCNVSYNDKGFTVIADKAYKKGEEVVISYGAHSNDLLWTDYGFLLDKNDSDSVCIDAWMLDPSTGIANDQTRRLLEDHGYWRNYTLSEDGPCYRTEMAIRTQILSKLDWRRSVAGEPISLSDEILEQKTREFLINKILRPCIATAMATWQAIQTLDSELHPAMVGFAATRWKQIQDLAEKYVSQTD